MRKLIGFLAAFAALGAIYLVTAGAASWDWSTAAQVFGAAIGASVVLLGLVTLMVWGFTGDSK